MATVVGIVNSGLGKVGAKKRITSLTEGSPNSRVANTHYETTRDDLLRSAAWNFAIARKKLAQNATAPEFGFRYAYNLPSDWLRTISVHDNDAGRGSVRYQIEGKTIVTDAPEIWIRYIRIVEDPNLMTSDFRELLALGLAVEFAVPVAHSRTLKDQLEKEFKQRKRRVAAADAIEDFPQEIPDGTWITHRESSSSESWDC